MCFVMNLMIRPCLGLRPSAKILWYLPIIPRLKRVFANVNDAKNLR